MASKCRAMQFMPSIIDSGYQNAITESFGQLCQAYPMPDDPQTPYARIQARMREKWPNRYPEGKKIPQRAVAALIGVSQPSAHKWEHGGELEMANAIKIALKLDVCVEWLLTGRGAKFPTEPSEPLLQEIIQAASAMHDTQRMDLLKYARYLTSGPATEARPIHNKAKSG